MADEYDDIDQLWGTMLSSEFNHDDMDRIKHEFFSNNGGVKYRNEIISLLSKRMLEDWIAHEFFKGIVYSEPWSYEEGTNGVDSVVKNLILDQMTNPY